MKSYIDRGRLTIPGWFARVDALLFAAIDDAQKRAGREGDLLEVGAYMGRSAVLLGYLQRSAERLVICDIFDGVGSDVSNENAAEHARTYADLSRRQFERNFLRFHARLPDDIIAAPSATLKDRLDQYAKRFRLIHIDGAHDFASVRDDLRLSRELLKDGGMVVFDDVNSEHTPGVAAAVWSAVVAEELIPHFVTKKLYASWDEVDPIDLSLLDDGWTLIPHIVSGHTILFPQESGNTQQELRKWIPPGLLPALERFATKLPSRGGQAED